MDHSSSPGNALSLLPLLWSVYLRLSLHLSLSTPMLKSGLSLTNTGEPGSQLPLYFVSASLSFIVEQVGGADVDSWLPQSYALAFASVAPFSGYLQDVFGRRYISLTGGVVLCIGLIVIGTTHTMAQGIVGCTISGIGAAIGELTALAGTSELVPVRKRGWYLGLVTGTILPFSPYSIYTTELGMHSTWRWGIWITL